MHVLFVPHCAKQGLDLDVQLACFSVLSRDSQGLFHGRPKPCPVEQVFGGVFPHGLALGVLRQVKQYTERDGRSGQYLFLQILLCFGLHLWC